jgi:1,4-dihydroxy-2-naphthoate octaprenyltransferase
MNTAQSSLEPSRERLASPLTRYLLATRPAFLTITLAGCLLGFATAVSGGVMFDWVRAAVTLLLALLAHAGINVLNDYCDHLNGSDARNTQRIYPFTGGSRFIQNGVLSLNETLAFGALLLVLVVLAGLWLTAVSASGLVYIGAAGLIIGWAYSAPPLKLNSRGAGEICVWAGFALIAVGADFVQRGSFSLLPLYAVSGYALLVTNILYINQFPDCKADATAGKHHWVVRLGPQHARWGYGVIAAAAYAFVLYAIMIGVLPWLALVSLLPAALSARAARDLLRHALTPSQLAPAIQMTIGAATLHGLLLAAAIVAARFFG